MAACAPDLPVCEQTVGKYYDTAVARQLERNKVTHRLEGDRGVCVSRADTAKLHEAMRQVNEYFHEPAFLLADECDERAVVAWATREKLPFEIRDPVGRDGKPTQRMFLIRSFSQEEQAANLRKVRDEAPKGVRCAPSTT
jgi:hypothetical protein